MFGVTKKKCTLKFQSKLDVSGWWGYSENRWPAAIRLRLVLTRHRSLPSATFLWLIFILKVELPEWMVSAVEAELKDIIVLCSIFFTSSALLQIPYILARQTIWKKELRNIKTNLVNPPNTSAIFHRLNWFILKNSPLNERRCAARLKLKHFRGKRNWNW